MHMNMAISGRIRQVVDVSQEQKRAQDASLGNSDENRSGGRNCTIYGNLLVAIGEVAFKSF